MSQPVDYGPKNFTISLSGTTGGQNHAPVVNRAGLGLGGGLTFGSGVLLVATPTTPDFAAGLIATLNGTTISTGHPPVKTNFGMPNSGRLYTSTFVPPVSGWKPRTILIT